MTKKEQSVSAIKEGTVIDHIPSDSTFKVVEILNLEGHRNIISIGTNLESKRMGKKGIVKVGGKSLTKEEVDKIALVAPNATVNIIKDYDVRKKLHVAVPDELENIIKCSNPNCITNNEKTDTKFYVVKKEPLKVKCHYCERLMEKEDIKLV
ncbi:aspartate carbamoyltransferase regulatory subunit [Candidatus Woesearchaeota archaeon]|nr:aspartate carbamoyltransferase regulatory subunit [Candidatus Woesearchaeota archaeon]